MEKRVDVPGKIETIRIDIPDRSPRPPESGISSVAMLIVSVLEDATYHEDRKKRAVAIIGRILDAEVAFAYERGKSDGMAFVIGAQK